MNLLSWALAQFLKTEEPGKQVRQLFFKIAEQLDLDTFLIYLRDMETGALRLDAPAGTFRWSQKRTLLIVLSCRLQHRSHGK